MSNSHIVCPSCNATNRIANARLNDSTKCGKCKSTLFTQQPIELTQQNFSKQIQRNDIPVVVDFWAPWCGPCKMMAPAFTDAAAQLEPYVRFAKVNTENEQAIGAQFNIRSIPTLAIFKEGKEVTRQAGAMSTEGIVNWVKANI